MQTLAGLSLKCLLTDLFTNLTVDLSSVTRSNGQRRSGVSLDLIYLESLTGSEWVMISLRGVLYRSTQVRAHANSQNMHLEAKAFV